MKFLWWLERPGDTARRTLEGVAKRMKMAGRACLAPRVRVAAGPPRLTQDEGRIQPQRRGAVRFHRRAGQPARRGTWPRGPSV